MPEQYTDEWWHIQAPPLVFPSDDFAEAMTQAIVRVHRKQLDDIISLMATSAPQWPYPWPS